MIVSTLQAMHTYLINSISHLTTDNCSIENASVFNNISVLDPVVEHAVIVAYAGADEAKEQSDFGSFIMEWRILVNLFHYLDGDDDNRSLQTMAFYGYADDIMNAVKMDSTLGGNVMDARLVDNSPTLAYKRSDISNYLMLNITFMVKENL